MPEGWCLLFFFQKKRRERVSLLQSARSRMRKIKNKTPAKSEPARLDGIQGDPLRAWKRIPLPLALPKTYNVFLLIFVKNGDVFGEALLQRATYNFPELGSSQSSSQGLTLMKRSRIFYCYFLNRHSANSGLAFSGCSLIPTDHNNRQSATIHKNCAPWVARKILCMEHIF